MALNKFVDTDIKEWMKIGCSELNAIDATCTNMTTDVLNCQNIVADNMTIPMGGDLTLHDMTSTGTLTSNINDIGTNWTMSQNGIHLRFDNSRSNNICRFEVRNGSYLNQTGCGSAGTGYENFTSSGATLDIPGAITNNTIIDQQLCNGHDGNNYARGFGRITYANEDWTPIAHGSRIEFTLCRNGTTFMRAHLTLNGENIIIGRTDGTNYSLPMTRGIQDQYLISDGSGVMTFKSRPFAELFWVNNAVVTVVPFNTWTPVTIASTSNVTLVDFTNNSLGRLTYTGTVSRLFKLSHSGTFLGTTATDVRACVGFILNGITFVTGAKNCWETINNVENYTSSIQKITTLNPGDFIEIGVINETNTDSLLVRNCNLEIIAIY